MTQSHIRLLINNINIKIIALRSCRKIFLIEAIFFLIQDNVFQSFPHNVFVIILRDIIGFENVLFSFRQSPKSKMTICNLHWCYTYCTGDTFSKLHRAHGVIFSCNIITFLISIRYTALSTALNHGDTLDANYATSSRTWEAALSDMEISCHTWTNVNNTFIFISYLCRVFCLYNLCTIDILIHF